MKIWQNKKKWVKDKAQETLSVWLFNCLVEDRWPDKLWQPNFMTNSGVPESLNKLIQTQRSQRGYEKHMKWFKQDTNNCLNEFS